MGIQAAGKQFIRWAKGRLIVLAVALLVAVLAASALITAATSSAVADSDSPLGSISADKTLTANGDGSYELALSAVGDALTRNETGKVDVILVLDTSGSMNYGSTAEEISTAAGLTASSTGAVFKNSNGSGQLFKKDSSGNYVALKDGETTSTYYYQKFSDKSFDYASVSVSGSDRYLKSSTKMGISQAALKNMASSLLALNAGGEDNVRLGLVSFSHNSSILIGSSSSVALTTDEATFDAAVDDMYALGATNWEAALQDANSIQTRSDAKKIVIFISDGQPTVRNSKYNSSAKDYESSLSGLYGTGSTDPNSWNFGAAQTKANAIVSAGKDMYAIAAFGTIGNMKTLVDTAYSNAGKAAQSADKYYQVSDENITQVLQTIVSSLIKEHTYHYTDTAITDTLSTAALPLNDDVSTWKAYRTAEGGTPEEISGESGWISYDASTRKITWDLNKIIDDDASHWITVDGTKHYLLQDGCTYTLKVNVYPTQEAFDMAADFTTGKTAFSPASTYTEDAAGNKYYESTDSAYQNYVMMIAPDGTVSYRAKSNDSAAVSYNTSNVETSGSESPTILADGTDAIDKFPTMELPVSTLKLQKAWANDSDTKAYARPDGAVKLTVSRYAVNDDGSKGALDATYEVTLDAQSGDTWETTIQVPAGPVGHYYTVTAEEDATSSGGTASTSGHTVGNYTLSGTDLLYKSITGAVATTDVITSTNTYKVPDLKVESPLEVTKNLTGLKDGRTWGDAETFSFAIEAQTAGAPLPTSAAGIVQGAIAVGKPESASASATSLSNSAASEPITFHLPGTYVYKLSEQTTGLADDLVAVAATYYATITVAYGTGSQAGTLVASAASYSTDAAGANPVSAAEFTNVYTAVDYGNVGGINITKTLTGRDATAGQFVFDLEPLDTASAALLPAGVYASNAASDGSAAEVIAWTNDSSIATQMLNDLLTNGTKTTLDSQFAALRFNHKMSGITYGWKFTERTPAAAGGYTADTSTHTIQITPVLDTTTGTFTVTTVVDANTAAAVTTSGTEAAQSTAALDVKNSYHAEGSYALTGTKTVVGRGATAGEFQFTLKDASGTVISQGTNAAADAGSGAAITFAAINFTSAAHKAEDPANLISLQDAKSSSGNVYTFEFTASETVDETYFAAERLTAQTSPYTITLTATDNGDGTISVSSSHYGSLLAFVNTYAPDPVDLTVAGKKQASSATNLTVPSIDGVFEVALYEGTDTSKTPLQTAKCVETAATAESVAYLKNGTFTFANALHFTLPGTYTYTVVETHDGATEVSPGVFAKDGFTYDSTAYAFTVVVEDVNHQLVVTSAPAEGDFFTCANTYSVSPVSVDLAGTKTVALAKASLTPNNISGKYSFTLYKGVGDTWQEVATVSNAGDAGDTVKFPAVAFTDPGTYTFKVVEAGTVPGFTNDEQAETGKTFSVTVVDNGDGTLSVEDPQTVVGSVEKSRFEFVNTYDATLTTPLPGTMAASSPDGAVSIAETHDLFSFKLYSGSSAEGEPLSTVGCDETGAIALGAATFGEPGEYTFTAQMVIPDGALPAGTHEYIKGGFSYDDTPQTFTVQVKDNGDGTLSLTSVPASGSYADFESVYGATGKAAIQVGKKLGGRAASAGEFTFGLKDRANQVVEDAEGNPVQAQSVAAEDGQVGAFVMPELSYTTQELADMHAAGTADFDIASRTYTIPYTVYELTDSLPGGVSATAATANVTVTLVDDKVGGYTATVSYPESAERAVLENAYKAASVSLTPRGVKSLVSKGTLKQADIAGAYTFNLYASSDATGSVIDTATNDASGNVQFSPIEFTAAGTYSYTVKEEGTVLGVTNDAAPYYGFTVEVTDDGSGQLKLTAYPAADMSLEDAGTGTGTGNAGTGNAGTGNAEENPLFTFTNVYDARGSVILEATDVLYGRDALASEFDFAAYDSAGKVVTLNDGTQATAKNSASADAEVVGVRFGQVDYTLDSLKAMVAAGTAQLGEQPGVYLITYAAKEATDALPTGVSCTTAERRILVTVTDDATGTLKTAVTYPDGDNTLVNVYVPEPVDVVIGGHKTATASEGLTVPGIEGKFSFQILDGSTLDAPVLDTASCTAAGAVTFANAGLRYDAVGTHKYLVRELVPEAAVETAADPRYEGFTYDESVVLVTVEITDDLQGHLVATVTSDDPDSTGEAADIFGFTNNYSVDALPLSFAGAKQVYKADGGVSPADVAGAYTFKLYEGGEALDPVLAEATNDAAGAISLGDVTITLPGEYTYTVTETGSVAGYTNDPDAKHFKVKVSDSGLGYLTAVAAPEGVSYEEADPASPLYTFTNTYSASGSVTLQATKVLTGRAAKAGEFSFGVKDALGNMVKDAAGDDCTAVNAAAADGEVAALLFKPIAYTTESMVQAVKDGVATRDPDTGAYHFSYTVYEDTGDLPENVTALVQSYQLEVVASDNGDGTLAVTAQYPETGAAFSNVYEPDQLALYISGAKLLASNTGSGTGIGSIAGAYTFRLYANGDTSSAPLQQATNDSLGNVDFPTPLIFSRAGSYTYAVTEEGSVTNVVNDTDKSKLFTIKVTDDGEGKLSASIVDVKAVPVQTENEDAAVKLLEDISKAIGAVFAGDVAESGPAFTFTNTYVEPGTSYTPKTGDGTPLLPLAIVVVAAGVVLLAALLVRSHRKRE